MNEQAPPNERVWLHLLLFVLTLMSTTWAGAEMTGRYLIYENAAPLFMIGGMAISWPFILDGFIFGGSLLLFLTVHEFGHYFAARYHGVSTTLPYYIPFPFNGIGTFGAVIRIRQQISSTKKLFDIGAAGPLAGFVVALLVLIIGFATLPGPDYIEGMPGHDRLKEYIAQNGAFPDEIIQESPEDGSLTLMVGMTPMYWILSQFFSDVPPMWEMYHYPLLFAGWLGLFFTALNLLPVGQLDGGHIVYSLIGQKWHSRLAKSFVLLLLLSGGIGFIQELKPVFWAWDPLLGELLWPVLAGVLFFYLYKIFDGAFNYIAPALVIMVAGVAAGSSVDWIVDHLGYSGWLVWCLLIILLIRIDHPPVTYEERLSKKRKVLAILSLLIFALCFSIKPLYIG
ncbi:MAG: site-2 protease family protein [Bacteroidetes bacterium]|nr:site-2 protease family protein [Bacteroidota bacterium]